MNVLTFSDIYRKSPQMELFWRSMASQGLLETIKKTQESTQTEQRNVKDLRFQFFEVNSNECAYIFALTGKTHKRNYSGGLWHPKGPWKQSRKHKKTHKQSKEMLKTCAFNFLRLIQVNVLTFSHTYRENPQKKLFWWHPRVGIGFPNRAAPK